MHRYLDASALVKLVVREPESEALARWLGGRDTVVSCNLARTEVVRAVWPSGSGARRQARRLIDEIDLVQLDDELEAVVTYDVRMAKAADALGLPVLAPA